MNYYRHKNLDYVMVVTVNDLENERDKKCKFLEKYCYTKYSYDTYVAFCLDLGEWAKFIDTKQGFAWALASGAAREPDLLKP